MQNNLPKLIIIGGPTAIGKTSLAIELAQKFNTEIISADSRQIYKQLNIGVGRPSPIELSQIKHHLIACIDIHQHYHTADFERDALQILDNLYLKKDVAIVCGGTGLYIQTLCDGIDNMPTIQPEIRHKLNQQYEKEGIEFLQEYIRKNDPETLAFIDINNPKRLIRAVEVMQQTQEKYSSFRKGLSIQRNFEPIFFCLFDEREMIRKNIEARVLKMLQEGWVEECISLLPYRHFKALQTLGYREIFDYLDQKITYQEMVHTITLHTQQYAKRQLTWFRRDKRYHWVKNIEEIYKLIKFN
ncbi:MAG: tRNA (adenosine(37)-N6)-dimethylallyltransferase MiaA [Chitinophagales bacterium]|nr:tRNA (adenosine(37)-N6)-dimethylallyltransferase MiaA [Chitinophagales bacterium]MCZ2393717.1 tRNA (adenosine(37)-N6)-dimethylallyltransferase MiaA [Chitinophagales bacterium]